MEISSEVKVMKSKRKDSSYIELSSVYSDAAEDIQPDNDGEFNLMATLQ